MNLVFADVETFWSETHSLSRMNPIEYVLHPETELQLLSLKVNDQPAEVAVGEAQIRELCATVDWSNAYAIGHNMSGFDALVLAWRLGVQPRMWGCTLAMARPLYDKTVGLSLGKQVAHHGIGVKNNAALIQTRGKKLADFTPDELQGMVEYNRDGDTEQCAALFHILKRHYTPAELWHIDCNIRMLVEPEFELDTALLDTALSVERSNKHKALLDLAAFLKGADDRVPWGDDNAVAAWVKTQMNSAAKFCDILVSRGVDVPLKYSKTDPEKQIPALAKTDEAMEELLDHDDEVVAAAARARLSAKSTQLETRIQLFQSTYRTVGKLPVPANYCGADTTGRDSGWLYNMYNLPRVNQKKPKVSDALRNSVRAPKDKVILVRDSSGIELRVNHTLWKVERSMRLWRASPTADLYIGTAASYYGVPESDITKEDPRRQFGKVLELSCGYGIGYVTLRHQARAQYGLRLTEAEAKAGTDNWRSRYPEIAGRDGGWQTCKDALHYIAEGTERTIDPWGMCTTEHDAIVLPSGRRIRYPNLRQEMVDQWRTIDGERVKVKAKAWIYDDMRKRVFLHGGKVDENIVQALSRDIVFDQALAFFKRTQMRPKHKVYDELVYLVDPAQAGDYSELLGEIMRAKLSWWPELVLWSEGGVASTYGAAK